MKSQERVPLFSIFVSINNGRHHQRHYSSWKRMRDHVERKSKNSLRRCFARPDRKNSLRPLIIHDGEGRGEFLSASYDRRLSHVVIVSYHKNGTRTP